MDQLEFEKIFQSSVVVDEVTVTKLAVDNSRGEYLRNVEDRAKIVDSWLVRDWINTHLQHLLPHMSVPIVFDFVVSSSWKMTRNLRPSIK